MRSGPRLPSHLPSTHMRSSIRRLATLFLCLAGGAYGQSPYKIFPSFELSAANANGEYKAVAGVKNYKPLVYDEGGITQGPQYWIRVKPVSIINKLSYEIFSLEHSREGQHIVFDIVLQSSEPVANPYAILTYNPDGQNWTACRYAEMKPLSGQRQRMRLRCSAKNVPADGWTLHIYSGNAELYDRARTDLLDASTDQAFQFELARYIASVGEGDAKPEPFYMPVSAPPADLMPTRSDSLVVKVKMTIDTDGRIAKPSILTKLPAGLREHILANLTEWRFFPRIQQGQLTPATVVLPLNLG